MAEEARRARWPRVVAVVVVVLVAVAGLAFWATRDRSRPVSLDEARERAGSTTTRAERPDLALPEPGVYDYRGSGDESLSTPPLSQSEGPTIPGTVEHLDGGCFRFRLDYSNNHWQTWDYCRRGRDLVERGGQSWQRWTIGPTAITNLSTFDCGDGAPVLPAERTVGQKWSALCTGSSDTVSGEAISEGPYEFVGEEEIDVGGTKIRTAHFLRRREMSGAQKGSERADVWFAVDTGLPVRNQRTIEVATDTPIGTSTYREVGELQLRAPSPTS